ncbi:MAG: hypothetical protein ABW321_21350, partial [Polyangiales bacterium]
MRKAPGLAVAASLLLHLGWSLSMPREAARPSLRSEPVEFTIVEPPPPPEPVAAREEPPPPPAAREEPPPAEPPRPQPRAAKPALTPKTDVARPAETTS